MNTPSITPAPSIQSVSENWENLAKEVIIKFYSRAGVGRGNFDRLIDFTTDLKNIVGFSLNCFQNADLPDPKNWSQTEQVLAENGKKQFSFDSNDDCGVIKAIKASCESDDKNYINVLPIVYHHESSLFFTPLFRLRRYVESKPQFVDSKGRIYKDFHDWEKNNRLPISAVCIYPTNGILDGSGVTRKIKNAPEDSTRLLGKAITLCETFGGPLATAITSPLAAVAPIVEMYDRVSHGESINPLADSEASGLWLQTTVKVMGPFGKMVETFGFSATPSTSKQAPKSAKISKVSVCSIKSILKNDEALHENAINILDEAKTLLENPMTIEEIVKLIKHYIDSPRGCLKASMLIGFYMNTKFFYYDKAKLLLINKLYDMAKLIDEAKTFRLTNNKEIIVGPLTISMSLMDNFTSDDIVKVVGGLCGLKDENEAMIMIKDSAKFFRSFNDFVTTILKEQQHKNVMGDSSESGARGNSIESLSALEELRVYASNPHLMLNYQKNDYELPKLNEKSAQPWFNVVKILEKRLTIFGKIIQTIRCHDFKSIINSGIIFQFAKLPGGFQNDSATVNESAEVLEMLFFVLKMLRKNFIPFILRRSPCGRPLFSIGYGIEIHLIELFNILSSDAEAVEVLRAICNLDSEPTKVLDEVKRNFNNDCALFKWLRKSFKRFDCGLKVLIELAQDALSSDFKSLTQLYIPSNELETNGLLSIQSGDFVFRISVHVLQAIERDQRVAIMNSFMRIEQGADLMSVAANVFTNAKSVDEVSSS